MRPAHGGRIVLRASSSGAEQRYDVELYMSGEEWRGTAAVVLEGGEVSFDDASGLGLAPAWLLQQTRALLRSLWRSHAEAGWPRRLTRWRPEPEKGSR
jgi:hypothetical protein